MGKIDLNKTNPSANAVMPSCADEAFGAYLKKISKYETLNAEQEKVVAKRVHNGDESAKKQMVQSNLKLVVNIARKIVHVSNLPMIDLIQEGNLGLMAAVEKFDYRLGYRFSTYAAWWIKQAIFKAISEQSHCMKIPVYIQETLSKFSKIKAQMEQEYNCSVRPCDVAKKMNIEPNKIDVFLAAFSKSLSIEGSFDLDNGNEVCLADILVDKNANIQGAVEQEALKSDIEQVLAQLKEREKSVVSLRFGLGELRRRTLDEIGKIYGVTKECVRQTELRALRKMREIASSNGSLLAYMH